MRWSWLRAVVLGFLIGPAPVSGEPETAELPETQRLFAAGGYVARGPGFYVWDEDSQRAAEWALELRLSTGETSERARWRSIATRSAARPPILRGEDDVEVARWIGAAPAGAADISPLGLLLCLLPSLDRTCLIASCATSSDASARLVLARALSAPFDAVGVRGAIEHLQQDPSATVRKLARSAAASRHLLA